MKIVNTYVLPLILIATMISGCSDDTETAASATDGASSGSDDGSSSGSLGSTTQTGVITHRDFHILYSDASPTVFNEERAYVQTTIQISIHADDVNDLNVSGQTVNFATEWGKWTGATGDSCILENGSCTVSWTSGDPAFAPADCVVSFTAWANGEEKFADANGNGLFDTGETLNDLEEPYLDINENGVYDNPGCNIDGVCEAIDIENFTGDTPGTINGMHDPADGLYNGSLCADVVGNPLCSSTATSTVIHTRDYLTVQDKFDDDGDPNTADVNICN